MNKILVTGGYGQLGLEIKAKITNYSNYNFLFSNFSKLDITNHNIVKNFLVDNKIDTIINCAAFTSVDQAELKTKLAEEVNHIAVSNLAYLAKEYSIKLIHISTDYVFDGKKQKPYKESDITNPQNIYGQTKLNGELAIQKINPSNTIIIRTSWLYSKYGNNFVNSILELAKTKHELNVVFDQVASPTYANDLAKTILHILPLINNNAVEIFHYSNEGYCSRNEFAENILKIKNLKNIINPIKSADYNAEAIRPNFSVLDSTKIKTFFKIDIPHWTDSLEKALQNI